VEKRIASICLLGRIMKHFKVVWNTNVSATNIKLTALAEEDMHVANIPNSINNLLGINL
jgi:hypothetical protein